MKILDTNESYVSQIPTNKINEIASFPSTITANESNDSSIQTLNSSNQTQDKILDESKVTTPSRRTLRSMKSPITLRSVRKKKDSRNPAELKETVEIKGNENECIDLNAGMKQRKNKKNNDNALKDITTTTPRKQKPFGLIKHMFKSTEKAPQAPVDMDIGIKLALPEKIGVMRGLETPSNSSRTRLASDQESDGMNDSSFFPTPQKKLMIVPEASMFNKAMNFKSPFKTGNKKEKKSHIVKIIDTSKSTQKDDIILRSSELQPSVHQMKIPSSTEILIHARVCALLEGYDVLLERRAKERKRWFSFGQLVGMSRVDLQNMYLSAIGKKPDIPLVIGEKFCQPPPLPAGSLRNSGIGNPFEIYSKDSTSLSGLTITSESTGSNQKKERTMQQKLKQIKPHPSTIKSLLECADDIIVEGYFAETIGSDTDMMEGSTHSNIQVAILGSQRQREFIVCFRGSMIQHSKPVKNKGVIQIDSNGVIDRFSDAYSEAGLESKVFKLLNKLMGDNPFCDVSFVGHSFGGCLATIAAASCAEKYPMMMVNCHLFGCPKIGNQSFKERSHSLPNLRIFRVEYGSDSCVNSPAGPSFQHVGHAIVIRKMKEKSSRNNASIQKERVEASVYKFGKKENQHTKLYKKITMKSDHEMRSYLHVIESFTHLGCQWIETFVGEGGDGILASNNEERLVV